MMNWIWCSENGVHWESIYCGLSLCYLASSFVSLCVPFSENIFSWVYSPHLVLLFCDANLQCQSLMTIAVMNVWVIQYFFSMVLMLM
jgi:hypothetical protein